MLLPADYGYSMNPSDTPDMPWGLVCWPVHQNNWICWALCIGAKLFEDVLAALEPLGFCRWVFFFGMVLVTLLGIYPRKCERSVNLGFCGRICPHMKLLGGTVWGVLFLSASYNEDMHAPSSCLFRMIRQASCSASRRRSQLATLQDLAALGGRTQDLTWFPIHYTWYSIILLYVTPDIYSADPGRIGKEAKQIGIKTLRCFAPWGFRPFSYVYCCEIYLIGLNFHL